jgi:hypothetical protein
MAEKKVIELEVNANLGTLKQQLKEAQVEVQTLSEKFGATSAQAVQAAKKAAILKDKIGDAKALTDAFNPDAKFKALSGALTGVAGGFSVVTGAMGAFGKQNEDVEKALLKVQSAMALASGAQAIGESIDSFKQLGAVIKANSVFQKILTAGQYAYNLAMSLNPVGAIVVAVIALIASGYALIKMFQASEQANAKNEAMVKKNTNALKEQIRTNDKSSEALKTKNGHEYEMAKASGASTKALRALALKHAEEQVALEKASLATALNTYEKEKNTLAYLRNIGASDELIQKQFELATEARKNATKERGDVQKALNDVADIKRKNAIEVRQELTDNNNKIKESNKSHNDEIKQQNIDKNKEELDRIKSENEEKAKAELDRIKSLNENILSLNEELRVSKLTEEQKEVDALNKKYDKVIEDGKKANIDVALLEEEKRLALLGVTKKYDDIEQATKDEKTAKEKEKIATEKAFLDELTLSEDELKLQKITAKYEAEKLLYKDNKEILKALDIKYDKDKEDLENKELARKRENTKKGIDMAMSALSVLNDAIQMGAGKSEKSQRKAFKAQKAFNLASAVVNTYLAVTGALTAGGNPIKLATGMQFVEAGIAGALGAVQIAKIAKTQFEGGASADTSGGGGGGGGGVTAPTMSAPQFNVVGQSGVNQLASLGQQPVQAYVVSGQVTSQQSLDRNRLANATLGG